MSISCIMHIISAIGVLSFGHHANGYKTYMDKSIQDKRESNVGRVVLITGSTRGIGLAAAAEFLRNGDNTAIFCRHQNHVDEAVDKLTADQGAGSGCEGLQGLVGDVRDPDSVDYVVKAVLERFGRIDILINNAGIAVWKPIEETTDDEWDEVIKTNLKGSFLFMRAVLPIMKRQGSGVIINISSGLGVQGQAKYSAYSASKFGLVGLVQVVADETSGTGIKVYAILPGGVATKLHLDMHPWEDPSKMMTPEHVAKTIFGVAEGVGASGSAVEVYF
ncbi:MAG: SDR family oxidoreductase [Actinomycetota bacterium]|nr:SDR family oxidoreductase [Actinomycetota bacterium]